MDNTIFATILDADSELHVVHSERGEKGLRNCQAYAQRLIETKQGVASVGVFKPLTKLEQKEIAKSNQAKIAKRASRAKSICTVVQCPIPEV